MDAVSKLAQLNPSDRRERQAQIGCSVTLLIFNTKCLTNRIEYGNIIGQSQTAAHGPVVQLVRTLACHARGRRFDPVPDRSGSPIGEPVCWYSSVGRAHPW